MFGETISGKESGFFRGGWEEMDRLLVKAPPVGFRSAKGFCREERAGQDPEWGLHHSGYISCFFFSTHLNGPASPGTSSVILFGLAYHVSAG